jgi:hypothetical protein
MYLTADGTPSWYSLITHTSIIPEVLLSNQESVLVSVVGIGFGIGFSCITASVLLLVIVITLVLFYIKQGVDIR